MNQTAFEAKLASIRVLPVVVIKNLEDTEPTLAALMEGGIPAAEITFRTACAADAIRIGAEKFPEMHIGAGTVINGAQAEQAIAAGATFIVSPGLSAEVAEVCKKADVPYFPGCATPTEIMQAISLGITTVKFFPANVYGGLGAIKALSGPFPQVKFLPTGGVDLSNIKDFLAFEKIVAVGGSFMMKGDIKKNCEALMEVLK
ncbi:MAG: bifunctional 4-hydroxy-2-oxoglutarate aldolase/2-dehydro-3-deoxy-phosphogluconate aldolase [Clostridia bacterium]|nr:bifunctional 4-hydroxy-2-oxoglutarate aldolase/2-dehydro-3-deoxy-phosphogluconate aldolase [Clostridia bacterium]MBQ5662302.1 bifunctional 4-hydroxy-2-oxoglutarate aldolase/2-dehydro-3-deoxy-phosphogluconate aldolase [Clostridia bacterium]MBQ5772765.1 bifunctional 4-hydroxy-2-oxoglutarate aldolase/2-dehydro-3-deoxy-phosphogluconate aldolase [Clostridia bacterium]